MIINDVSEEDLGAYYCKVFKKKTGELLTSVEFELQLSDGKILDNTPELEVIFLSNNIIELGSSFQIQCLNKSSNLKLKYEII